ncbi:unnamed protein product [Protopolystoma xenopodis]|uniref:Uncharacterized protein n=1 Tax=Protopolystoma xenopodis TaxID=117903 RepID=A0A3S5BKL0_9PLAT|nr:unnamed protein product [Protopolystoma xenopodis]
MEMRGATATTTGHLSGSNSVSKTANGNSEHRFESVGALWQAVVLDLERAIEQGFTSHDPNVVLVATR